MLLLNQELANMALYEFVCPECKKQFEVRRSIHEADKITNCPSCGKKANKLVSVFSAKIPTVIDIAGEKLPISSKVYGS